MQSTEYLSLLKEMPGVVRVELAPADLLQSVAEMEASISRSSTGMRLENIGIFQCLHHQMVAIAFCDSGFKRTDDITIRMIDMHGTVIGHDVPESRVAEFEGREDVTWFSHNFVMYLDRVTDSDAKMVMGSSDLEVAGAPGVSSQMFLPSLPSAEMICSRFSVDGPDIATAIIGVDGVEVDPDGACAMIDVAQFEPNVVGGTFDRD